MSYPVRWKEFTLHVLVLAIFSYAYSIKPFIPGASDTYGGRYKYLTILNLLLSIAYYSLSVFVDLKEMVTKKKGIQISKLKQTRDYIFCSILFPLSTSVSFLYWGLFITDPELISTPATRVIIPTHSFYNHAAHSVPVISSLLESLLTYHQIHPHFFKGALGGIVFSIGYLIWIMWVAFWADIWVYPILKVLTPISKTVFLSCGVIFGLLIYELGVFLKKLRWSEHTFYKKIE